MFNPVLDDCFSCLIWNQAWSNWINMYYQVLDDSLGIVRAEVDKVVEKST